MQRYPSIVILNTFFEKSLISNKRHLCDITGNFITMKFSRIRARRYTGPQELQTKEKRHSTARYKKKNDLILIAVPKYKKY